MALLSMVVAATVAGQVPVASAAAAVPWTPPKTADAAGVKLKPVSVTPRPDWTAADREVTEADLDATLPAAGVQTVDLAKIASVSTAKSVRKSGAQVGSLPVFVAPVAAAPSAQAAPSAGASAAPVGKVRVQVLDRKATSDRGLTGLALRLSRADGQAQAGKATVTVDYRSFARAFGNDAASRLRFVRIPDGQPLPSVNDRVAGTVSAMTSLAAGGAVTELAVAAAPEGDNGDYKATTLSAASTWQVSQQTGAFSWSYPLEVPSAPGGVVPSLALSYNSAAVDGQTSGTNTQGSWAGDGWSIGSGYIERSYRSCTDDRDTKEKTNPNNADAAGGDLCYFDDNATMSFNGSATGLVKVPSTDSGDGDKTVQYRGVSDDGSKVELLTDGRDNGDDDGSYWRLTNTSGVQFYFGRDKGQGGTSSGTKTNSVWTVPVYSNHPDDPGYDKEFTKSRHTRGWRWNLDYAVDPSGNTTTYFYDREIGAYAREADKDKRTTYDRGGYLTRIEYGGRSTDAASVYPADRVLLNVADRCVGTCVDDTGKLIKKRFPDTPWEQYCDKAPCETTFTPTFWTQKRLSTVTTQVYSGSGDDYTDVDRWTLKHTYLMAGMNEGMPMWLKSITHTGLVTGAGGAAVTDPPVTFDPNADVMPNRVDGPSDGHSSLFRNRIAAITTESGAQIGVTYSGRDCTRSTLPKPWSNTKRCFPQFYGAEGETPKLDWFHKYAVTRVDLYDNTGGFDHEQTNYDYLDAPAWAYDDTALTKPKKRTWGQYRGYGRIRVRQGLESGVQSATEYRYFRGMDGDKQPKDAELPPIGTPRDKSVEDSLGGKLKDTAAFAGMLREQIVYNGVGTDWVSGTFNTPGLQGPTATYGDVKSFMTNVGTVRGRTKLSDGNTRWTKKVTSFNSDNLAVKVNDFGDEADLNDDRCSRNEYVRNEAKWMLNSVKRVESLGVNCDATVQRPRDVLSDTRTYYDDPDTFGADPTRGLPVRSETLASYSGSTPQYVDTARTGYDTLGRVTTQSDALRRVTTTDYTPVATGPLTKTVVTDPAGHTVTKTFNAALAAPVKTVDIDGGVTEMTYDGAGQLLAAWGPGRPKANNLAVPNASFAYQLRNNAPSTVTSRTLTAYNTKTYKTSVTLLDGMLRLRQTQVQTPAGGRAVSDTVYNSRGLVDWSSSAYYDIDNAPPGRDLVTTSGRPEIPALTQNVYDGAGRLTDAIFTVTGKEKWRTHTTFAGERTSVTPPTGGVATTSITDGRGRTVQLRQYKDPDNVGTDTDTAFDKAVYSYNDRDQLAQLADSSGNIWSYEYDQRGRKTVDRDPDKGLTISEYDDAGQLSWAKDARGKILAFTYDDLGRKTSVRQGTADGPKLTEWVYDTLPNGTGHLAKAIRYEPAGSANAYVDEVTGYDAAGRPTGRTVSVPSTETDLCVSGTLTPCSYSVKYTYRPDGSPDQVKYPALGGLPAENLTTYYNNVGLVDGLIGEITGNNQIYSQDVVYNQLGQLTQQVLGEHGARVALTTGYDTQTGRMTSFNALPEVKPEVYDLAYTQDHAGNITRISDTPDSGQATDTQCFRYDHQKRLTDGWTPTSGVCATAQSTAGLGGAAPYWHSYTYDAMGNRLTDVVHGTTNVTRTYGYPPVDGKEGSRPHAVTKVLSSVANAKPQQYSYDASGNLVCRPTGMVANTCAPDGKAGADSQALAWDDEGHLATSTDKTGTTTFQYDADGARLVRRDPTGTTLYLPNGTELRKPTASAAIATRYYSHGGSTIAVRTPTALNWLVSDHHGTGTAVVASDTNLTVTRRRTTPFGDTRGTKPAAWAGDKGFVGGTQDNTGLTHLGAREYDPSLGRFISIDPVLDLNDPQQWNAYVYSNNSPVTMSDPSGLLGSASCAPGEVGGPGACTGNENGSGIDPSKVSTGGTTSGNNGNGNGNGNGGAGHPDPGKCSGWWCKAKGGASTAWQWTKDHKAEIAGVAVGVVVGVGCTALTGGAGAVVCGAIGGALGSLTTGWMKGDRGGDLVVDGVSGAAMGALGGAGGAVLGQGASAVWGGCSRSGLTAAKGAGGWLLSQSRQALTDLAPKAVGNFAKLSAANIMREVREQSVKGATRNIARDMGRGMMSGKNSIIPAGVASVVPSDWNAWKDVANDGFSIHPENMIGPLLGGPMN